MLHPYPKPIGYILEIPINKHKKQNCPHPKIVYNITVKTQQKIIQNSRKNKKLRKKYVFSKKTPFIPYYDWAKSHFSKHTTVCYFIPRGMF